MKAILVLTFLLSLPSFAQTATIIKMKGQVYGNGIPVKEGYSFGPKDKVEVIGKDSFVHVKLEDESMFLQKEGVLKLKVLQKGKTLIELIKGAIFIFKNPKVPSKLNVKTKMVTMAVRGTKFYVKETNETYLCVCEGTVAAKNAKGILEVYAGEDLFSTDPKSYEKKKAKEDMIKMASEGFDIMGIPVK